MVSNNSVKTYEAPESEALVFQVECNFLTDSPQTLQDYQGNFDLEGDGLGNGGELR